jgi:hypothetical protein
MVSHEVVRWDLVLCRVMPGGPVASLWGPVLVYAPDEEPELRAELARLAEAHGLSRDLGGFIEVFRAASRELLRFVPPSRLAEPSYFTAEGDPIVSASAVWRLADPDAAFVALDTPPELLWVGESEDGTGDCFQLTADRNEFLARRPPLPPNALYFESSYAGLPNRIGTGTFVLAGCDLRFDAISEQRVGCTYSILLQIDRIRYAGRVCAPHAQAEFDVKGANIGVIARRRGSWEDRRYGLLVPLSRRAGSARCTCA